MCFIRNTSEEETESRTENKHVTCACVHARVRACVHVCASVSVCFGAHGPALRSVLQIESPKPSMGMAREDCFQHSVTPRGGTGGSGNHNGLLSKKSILSRSPIWEGDISLVQTWPQLSPTAHPPWRTAHGAFGGPLSVPTWPLAPPRQGLRHPGLPDVPKTMTIGWYGRSLPQRWPGPQGQQRPRQPSSGARPGAHPPRDDFLCTDPLLIHINAFSSGLLLSHVTHEMAHFVC